MSTNSKFWMKLLDCPSYSKIQHEISTWLNPQLDFYKDRSYYFEHIKYIDLFIASPTLFKWLHNLKIGPVKQAALIINRPNSRGDVHTDTQINTLALNIGIQTVGTYTVLYDMSEGVPYEVTMPTGNTLTQYDKCKLNEHVRYDLIDNPVIFNTKQLHQVINPTDEWRLAISLRFENDPWHLINNQ
jgi:hypothetical protein